MASRPMSVCLSVSALQPLSSNPRSHGPARGEGASEAGPCIDGAILDGMRRTWEKVCGRLVEGTRGALPGWAGCLLAWPTRSASSSVPTCLSHPAGQCLLLRTSGGSGPAGGLNESSVLHTLRPALRCQPAAHKGAGPSLLVLSPRGPRPCTSEKVPHRPTTLYLPVASTFPGPASSTWHPTGLLSTLTVTLGQERPRDGDRSRTTTTTSA